MEEKHGFLKMTLSEFENWIATKKVARTVITLQQHHTFSPDYSLFDGGNHFDLQKSMRNFHVHHNGWADIGQHFTIFPDGIVMTGRSLEKSPACIYMNNANAICIENLGNFDVNGDIMTTAQKDSIVRATAAICTRFSIPVNTDKVVYHHWFRLSDGVRNDGGGGNKSCPGTNFFGGNKVTDCQQKFLPLVRNALAEPIVTDVSEILRYACVTAQKLNIRTQPDKDAPKVADREPATLGAILRVYKIQDNWYRISHSKRHWVSARYTQLVHRAVVKADALNVRNAPNADGLKLGALTKGEEVFVFAEENAWCRIGMEEKWVKKDFLTIQSAG